MLKRKLTLLTLGTLVLFASCEPDAPEPTDNRDTYTGTWTLKETSQVFGSSTYQVNLKSSTESGKILIENFYNLGFDQKVTTTLSGSSFTIPSQSVSGHQVSGSGSAASDKEIGLNYTVNDGSGDDVVSAVLTR